MGRPSKLTDEVQQRLIEATRLGVHREIAAEYAGISVGTFYRWMQEGATSKKGSRLREFHDALRGTETALELELAGRVVLASRTEWRAAVELLKRRYPERWGNTVRLAGHDGGPLAVTTREQALDDGKERSKRLRAV